MRDDAQETVEFETAGIDEYVVLPLRDMVLFPEIVAPLGAVREKSIRALQAARDAGEQVLAITQLDPDVRDPEPDDLYEVGTLARPVQVLELPDGSLRIVLEGITRVVVMGYTQEEPFLRASVAPVRSRPLRDSLEVEATSRAIRAAFQEAASISAQIPPEALVLVLNAEDPGRLCDTVATYVSAHPSEKQRILETIDIPKRLGLVQQMLSRELSILRLEQDLHSRVRAEMEDTQREHYLREQMRAIQDELGEMGGASGDLDQYRERLLNSLLPDEALEKGIEELERLEQMAPASPEVSVIRTYLDWLLTLPWATVTADEIDISRAAQILEEDHHGLKKVKERVLEFLAVRKLVTHAKGPILCFMGPPGVGKTSIGRSIARAMGREFIRISLGGVHDEAEIRGHRRTYVGALPGKVIQALRRVKSNNPVFMIDEIDKIGADFRGDPSSALLEVLDPEQNDSFRDHYLEVAYDLSNIMFIATGNLMETIPSALRDRMEVIDFPGYTEDEKLRIASRFLVKRQRKEHGVTGRNVRFNDSGLRYLITRYTREAGVRNLERNIAGLCRKVAVKVASGEDVSVLMNPERIREYLGPEPFRSDRCDVENRVGVITGLSYTQYGGDIIRIEVAALPGEGKLTLTGQLGDVMKESAQAAVGYARSQAVEWGIAEDFFRKHDIHVHVPEGAVPKEGPSAGIAICAGLASALRGVPARCDVAMTGEVTLHGRALPIGGVREKVLAAHRAGVSTVLLPAENQKDLEDTDGIPAEVRRDLQFVFVNHVDEAIACALVQA